MKKIAEIKNLTEDQKWNGEVYGNRKYGFRVYVNGKETPISADQYDQWKKDCETETAALVVETENKKNEELIADLNARIAARIERGANPDFLVRELKKIKEGI